MNTTNNNTVVILGAGATIGSDYRLCGQTLPGDRDFFSNSLVQDRVSKYHALNAMLSVFREVHGDDLARVGLEQVWTFLDFSSRDLYRPLTDLAKDCKEWLKVTRKSVPKRDDDHYWTRYYRADRTIPVPNDIDRKLHLLAGWDLRRLVSEIYGAIKPPAVNIYDSLLDEYDILRNRATIFISLNYDLVLEHALNRVNTPWYYAHVSTTEDRDQDGIQVIKPHGSLNWLFKGNVPSVSIRADYRGPVAHRSWVENRFREALIIPPTHLKQPVNIPETQATATKELLAKLWKSMADALINASRVFIIGYSFPSTDHHLRTLFYRVNHKRAETKLKYREVRCCTWVPKNADRLARDEAKKLFEAAEGFFPTDTSRHFYKHKKGFKDFVNGPSP